MSKLIYLGYLQFQSEVCLWCQSLLILPMDVFRVKSQRYNFQPSDQSWAPQCTASQTERQTDRQTCRQTERRQFDINSGLYCLQQYDRLKIDSTAWHSLYMITTSYQCYYSEWKLELEWKLKGKNENMNESMNFFQNWIIQASTAHTRQAPLLHAAKLIVVGIERLLKHKGLTKHF